MTDTNIQTLQGSYTAIREAATDSIRKYGDEFKDWQVPNQNDALVEMPLHSKAAQELASVYSKPTIELNALDREKAVLDQVSGHAKAAVGIFAPLAKTVENIRRHRIEANLLETKLNSLRSSLREAFAPLVDAALSAEKKPLNERARAFFQKVSAEIKQRFRQDYDFLFKFNNNYAPDADYRKAVTR